MSNLTQDERLKLVQTMWPNEQLQPTINDDWYLTGDGALRHFDHTTDAGVGAMMGYMRSAIHAEESHRNRVGIMSSVRDFFMTSDGHHIDELARLVIAWGGER